jgi:hypothetical protein
MYCTGYLIFQNFPDLDVMLDHDETFVRKVKIFYFRSTVQVTIDAGYFFHRLKEV